MRVGLIGTGAISNKHAQAYKNIGYEVTACTDIHEPAGRAFAERWGCEFVPTYQELCKHPNVDYVDLCTFSDFRLEPIKECVAAGKSIQVQKPMSTNLETARQMIDVAKAGGIQLGVVSLRVARSGFTAAAAGSTRPGTAGRRAATSSRRPSASLAWASAP